MSRNLIIDVGNTNTKVAVFDEDEMVKLIRKPASASIDSAALFRAYNIDRFIVSDVTKRGPALSDMLKHRTGIVLSADTQLPFTVSYDTPATLGRDRIAAVAGGLSLFPDRPLLIVDTGTCITYEWVEPPGKYLGGNISPGLEMRYKAMHAFTARLPRVDVPDVMPAWPFGDSTTHALQFGGLMGCIYEMDGYIRRCREQFPDVCVLVSGGDAALFVQHSENEIFAEPNLVLLGLNYILNYNAQDDM